MTLESFASDKRSPNKKFSTNTVAKKTFESWKDNQDEF